MGNVADNIASLNAYSLDQGEESDARLNVEKLRAISPRSVYLNARRILPSASSTVPFRIRARVRKIVGPAIAMS